MPNHIGRLLSKVLKAYNVFVSNQTIEKTMQTHPAYPSIQSISDALDCWKVKHAVLKLSFDKLRALEVPVIAHKKNFEYSLF